MVVAVTAAGGAAIAGFAPFPAGGPGAVPAVPSAGAAPGAGSAVGAGAAPVFAASPPDPSEIRVSGRVAMPAGAPAGALAAARVELVPVIAGYETARRWLAGGPASTPLAAVHPEADGAFLVRAPRPGCYRLVVHADGYLALSYPLWPLVEDRELPLARLQVAARSTIEAVGADGKPLPGVLIEVRRLTGAAAGPRWDVADRSGRTDARGRLAMARGLDERIWAMSIDPRFSGQTFELRGVTARMLLVRQRPVVVVATDSAGRALPGTLLRSGELPVAIADDSGRLEVALDERGPTAFQAASTLESPAGDLRVEVTAARPRSGSPARVALAPLPAVTGQLIDAATRRPIAGGLVWSAVADPTEPNPLTAIPITASPAAPDGRFRLPVPAGSAIRWNATAPGYLPATMRVPPPPVAARTSDPSPAGLPISSFRVELTPAATLSGQVVDRSGTPVAGAEATVVEAAARPLALGIFDADREGRFHLTPLVAGHAYYIAARAPGFAPALRLVHAPAAAGPSPPQAPASPARSSLASAPLRIVLDRGVSVTGRVVAADGRPLRGALVSLNTAAGDPLAWISSWSGNDTPPAVRSGPAGRFELDHLEAGRYRLRATAPGFAPLSGFAVEATGDPARIDLGILTLQAASVIEALVVDPRGVPVPGATAVLSPLSSQSHADLEDALPSSAATADDGRVRFSGLAPGSRHDLTVDHPDYRQATLPAITAPTANPVRVELQEGHRLTGRVLDGDGQPIAGAAVGVFDTSLSSAASLAWTSTPGRKSDSRGEFSLSGLAAGTVQVQATAPGYKASRIAAQIPEHEPPWPLEIVLAQAGWLSGHVRDGAGEPLALAMVSVLRQGASPIQDAAWFLHRQPAMTDGAGEYRIDELDPGIYTVRVSPMGRAGSARPVPPVEIRSGANDLDLVVEMAKTWEVSGEVTDPAGNPVGGLVVQMSPRPVRASGAPDPTTGALDASAADASADAEPDIFAGAGEATMVEQGTTSLADGTFLFPEVADGAYELRPGRRGFRVRAGTPPVIVAGGPVTGVQLVASHAEALISGRLLRLAPAELAGARIDVTPGGPNRYEAIEQLGNPFEAANIVIDPGTGSFQILELTAGTWNVSATAGSNRHASGQVELPADTSAAVLDLDFAAGATLSGQVTMAQRPVAGASVALRSTDPQAVTGQLSAQTAADGTFTLPDAPLGTYQLVVISLPSGILDRRTIEVTGDQVLAIVAPGGTVHGVITAGSRPVAGAQVSFARDEMSLAVLVATLPVVTDASGAFDLAVTPGTYEVTVTAAGFAAGRDSHRHRRRDGRDRPATRPFRIRAPWITPRRAPARLPPASRCCLGDPRLVREAQLELPDQHLHSPGPDGDAIAIGRAEPPPPLRWGAASSA